MPAHLLPRSNVHEGFYNSYLAMASQLQSAVDGLGSSDIFATGHSLGAALANLAAFELTLAGYPVSAMINFGQPRVGDPTYADCFTSTLGSVAAGRPRAASAPINWRAFARAAAAASALPAHAHLGTARLGPLHRQAVANATLYVSPLLLKAVERALAHPINKAAVAAATAAEWTDLRVLLSAWSRTSVAVAQKRLPVSQLLPHARAVTSRHVQLLASLALPLDRDATPSHGPSASRVNGSVRTVGTGSGAASYVNRVVHYADVVPHVPPEAFGFRHAPQEVW